MTAKTLAVLLIAILINSSSSRSVSDESGSRPSDDHLKIKDKFAQEAADVLDSTLLFFKNGFADLVEDSSKINDVFSHISESLQKLAHNNLNQTTVNEEDPSIRLRKLAIQANKTMAET